MALRSLSTAVAAAASLFTLAGVCRAQPTTPERNGARYMLTLGADVAPTGYLPRMRSILYGYGSGGSATVRGTFYGRPIADDNSPRDLQPYLQRAPVYSISFGIGTHDRALGPVARTEDPNVPSGPTYAIFREWTARSALDVDQYFTRVLAIWGSIGITQTSREMIPMLRQTFGSPPPLARVLVTLPAALGIGIRIDSTRVDLGYRLEPYAYDSQRVSAGFLYGVSAKLTTVIGRRVRLALGAELIPLGARGWTTTSVYPTRSFGVHVSASFAHGGIPSLDGGRHNQVRGDLGLTCWFTSSVGASLGYSIAYTDDYLPRIDHVFAATFFARQ